MDHPRRFMRTTITTIVAKTHSIYRDVSSIPYAINFKYYFINLAHTKKSKNENKIGFCTVGFDVLYIYCAWKMSRKIRNNLNLLVDSDDVCDQITTMGMFNGHESGKKAITTQHSTYEQRQKTRYGICIEMYTATVCFFLVARENTLQSFLR